MDIQLIQKYYNKTEDKISIIIPCYNREEYISECLDSIFSQTVPLSLIEIVCIDDCSTDNTVSIIESYEKQYPDNILLVKCDTNSGGYIGKVRNIGLEYASGNYILFVDSDDKLANNALEKLYIGALISNADVTICGFYEFKNDVVTAKTPKTEFIYKTSDFKHFCNMWYNEGISGYICGKLYKSSLLNTNHIRFKENLRLAEDTLFFEEALLSLNTCYVLQDCLYYYRINDNGTWNSEKTSAYLFDCIKAHALSYDDYINNHKEKHILKYGHSIDDIYAWKTCVAALTIKKKCYALGQMNIWIDCKDEVMSQLFTLFPNITELPIVKSNDNLIQFLTSDKS